MLLDMSYFFFFFTLESSQVFQISMPSEFWNKKYGYLFRGLAENGVIALGLLRSHKKSGCTLPYVYTNPEKETELYQTDKIFVLSLHQPIQKQKTG